MKALFKFDNQEIKNLSPKDMENYILEKAKEMALNLENMQNEIQEAKALSQKAKEYKIGGFFSGLFSPPIFLNGLFDPSKRRLEKKTNILAEAQQQANEALSKMNDIIQESIRFNCASLMFAKQMNQALGVIISEGIKNSNGSVNILSKSTNEAIEAIMEGTRSFIKQQEMIKEELKELDTNIETNSKNIDINRENIAKNLKNIDTNKENIASNAENIEINKAKLKEIENKIKSKNIISIIALGLSIISLAFHFIKF